MKKDVPVWMLPPKKMSTDWVQKQAQKIRDESGEPPNDALIDVKMLMLEMKTREIRALLQILLRGIYKQFAQGVQQYIDAGIASMDTIDPNNLRKAIFDRATCYTNGLLSEIRMGIADSLESNPDPNDQLLKWMYMMAIIPDKYFTNITLRTNRT